MMKLALLALFVATVLSRTYPLFKQCDARWAHQQLGTSSNTICSAGCAMSSLAMGLAGVGKNYNPSTLNSWLRGHGGYVSGDLLVWGSVTSLGLSFKGKVGNGNIAGNVNAGNVVICNVHNGGHWVLATSVSGSTVFVNDPGYSVTSYPMSGIVDGQNAVYGVVGSESEFTGIIDVEAHQAPLTQVREQ